MMYKKNYIEMREGQTGQRHFDSLKQYGEFGRSEKFSFLW